MKKMILTLLSCFLIASLSACGNTQTASDTTEQTTQEELKMEEVIPTETGEKTLVAYFAYSENIGDTSDMSVEAISSASLNRQTDNESSNLQVMAQVIKEHTNADVFQILVSEPYDLEYDVMRERAYEELDNASFPELQSTVENLNDYDVIYIGTPIWSGRMPRPIASFLNENDLSGKTIVPFGIHLGSGFGSIIQEMEELSPNAVINEGFTINASTDNNEVKEQLTEWLNSQQ